MKEVAILGAGQLGSRHLQGILKSKLQFNVSVIDPSEESLDIARTRASEVEHEHYVNFAQSVDELPAFLEMVIIATNSNVRLSVLLDLLNHAKVSTLILEKVLFQKIEDYEVAIKALKAHEVKCWVNHPRRMQFVFQKAKKIISGYSKEEFNITVYGSSWGLGCNGLHMSDVMEYILDDKVESYNNDELDSALILSKRSGYYEFTGCLKGTTENGHRFSIISTASTDGVVTPVSWSICSVGLRMGLIEGSQPAIMIAEQSMEFKAQLLPEKSILYQSDLSTIIINKILSGELIELPTYKIAMNNHLLFIDSLNDHIGKVSGKPCTVCPIT